MFYLLERRRMNNEFATKISIVFLEETNINNEHFNQSRDSFLSWHIRSVLQFFLLKKTRVFVVHRRGALGNLSDNPQDKSNTKERSGEFGRLRAVTAKKVVLTAQKGQSGPQIEGMQSTPSRKCNCSTAERYAYTTMADVKLMRALN